MELTGKFDILWAFFNVDVVEMSFPKVDFLYLNEEDKPRTITANLNKVDYEKAIEAHSHGNHVEIVGDITNSGKKNATITCESFAILD